MSAVEALAEVLRQGIHDYVALSDERPLTADDPSLPDSMAAALVAAIRSMPAEQVAELIDGTTQRVGRDEDGLHRYRACGGWSDWR